MVKFGELRVWWDICRGTETEVAWRLYKRFDEMLCKIFCEMLDPNMLRIYLRKPPQGFKRAWICRSFRVLTKTLFLMEIGQAQEELFKWTERKKKKCHYFKNKLVCPFSELGCMFEHELSWKGKFDQSFSVKLCPYQHSDSELSSSNSKEKQKASHEEEVDDEEQTLNWDPSDPIIIGGLQNSVIVNLWAVPHRVSTGPYMWLCSVLSCPVVSCFFLGHLIGSACSGRDSD